MIIDGRKIAEEILAELEKENRNRNKPLKLAAVLVGNNSGSRKFLELKKKTAEKIGIQFEMKEFAEDLPEGVLLSRLRTWISESRSDGVLIELPLPRQFNTAQILNVVSEEKDVDVLSETAQKKFFSGDFHVLPPAVAAVKAVFEEYKIRPEGKKIVVFGQGLLVGKPIAYWLYRQGGLVSVVDEFTKNPERYSQEAEILISGVGKAHLIGGEMIKEGAAIIDFGYENREGRMVGDVNFEEVKEKASLITPVPGGVGPIVIAAVLKNLLILSKPNL